MRISDWSSDVCSSDLLRQEFFEEFGRRLPHAYEWRRKAGGQQAPGDLVGQVAEQLVRARYLSECAGTQTKDVLCEPRSEERRVGNGCVSTCRSRWSP